MAPSSPYLDKAVRYDAFLSYSTVPDYWIARHLEGFLEGFHKLDKDQRLGLCPLDVCRDASDFGSSTRLLRGSRSAQHNTEDMIDEMLARSEVLVVLCSKSSAKSPWVDREVEWFLTHRGPGAVLLCVTEGDPDRSPQEVFSPRILKSGLTQKPWYDLRGYRWWRGGRRQRKIRLLSEAKLALGSHLNARQPSQVQSVWQQEQVKVQRRRWLATLAVLVVVSALATTTWLQLRKVSSNLAATRYLEAHRAVEDNDFLKALVLTAEALAVAPRWDSRTATYRARALELAVEKAPFYTLNLPNAVGSATFSSDKQHIAVTTPAGTLGVWNVRTGKPAPRRPVRSTGRGSFDRRADRRLGTADAQR